MKNLFQIFFCRFRVTRPNASKSNAIVEVTLDRLLTASIVFKGELEFDLGSANLRILHAPRQTLTPSVDSRSKGRVKFTCRLQFFSSVKVYTPFA